jgi:hypothetical protein
MAPKYLRITEVVEICAVDEAFFKTLGRGM